MDQSEVMRIVSQAESAVAYAQQVRTLHRKRTERGSGNRETDIRVAQHKIRTAMSPIRSLLGSLKRPLTPEQELARVAVLSASADLQAERRKLWKMRAHKKKRKGGR